MESVWYDLRFAFRVLRRSPGFTCVAVLSLALGIGANTAIFSLIHAVLIRNLPVPQPKQLVLVEWEAKEWPGALRQSGFGGSLSYGAFQALHPRTDIVDGLFGFAPFGFDPVATSVEVKSHIAEIKIGGSLGHGPVSAYHRRIPRGSALDGLH